MDRFLGIISHHVPTPKGKKPSHHGKKKSIQRVPRLNDLACRKMFGDFGSQNKTDKDNNHNGSHLAQSEKCLERTPLLDPDVINSREDNNSGNSHGFYSCIC